MTNREFFAQLCTHEHPRFLGVLEAMPKDRLEYRPHPKSRSAHELVGHLIGHEQDLVELLQTGSINHRNQVPFQSMEEAVAIYKQARKDVEAKLAATNDTDWDTTGSFNVNGNAIMQMPRHGLAWMLMLDAIHHRGQLSTYLRPMGGKVPSIYGPSGDTAMGG
jgi:uncharacterized damage-inducible protein DinB